RSRGSSGHRGAMVNHLLQGDGKGGGMPLHHHAEGIAHQENISPRVVENPGERRVVGGDHADLLADLLEPFETVDGDLFLHGSPPERRLSFCQGPSPSASDRRGPVPLAYPKLPSGSSCELLSHCVTTACC